MPLASGYTQINLLTQANVVNFVELNENILEKKLKRQLKENLAMLKNEVAAVGSGRYAYDANGNMTSRNGSSLSWYSYDLPRVINQGTSQSRFWYGPARNRWKQVASGPVGTETTIYVGDLLEKVTQGSKTSWRHYIQVPTGTAAIHVRHADGSTPRTYLVTQDHLGGTDTILDSATGSLVVREAFDPFGRRRASSGVGVPGTAEMAAIGVVTRDGFTGHEHLDNVGLVHMNGRVYDPAIARFLSPDPVVTSPFNGRTSTATRMPGTTRCRSWTIATY